MYTEFEIFFEALQGIQFGNMYNISSWELHLVLPSGKRAFLYSKLQEVFCACWTWYLIVLLIKIDYGCFSTDQVVGENTFLFYSESWQYVKKKKKKQKLLEKKKKK